VRTISAFIAFSLILTAEAQVKTSTLVVDASSVRIKINKNIYGQFSEHLGNCVYGGIWVGENSAIPNTHGIRKDVVEALKNIKVPVLRWPGGCFADEYHWKDGIGPRDKRPTMINTNWGGVTEDNSFGTHEFLELCRQIGCEPYFSGNVGSGTVQELSQWVEYVNSDNVSPMTALRKQNGRDTSWGVTYWGIGNESWGCGGTMRAEFYADQAKRYGTYMRDYGKNKVFKIACGPSDDNYDWTETIMKDASGSINGLSLHHYAFNDGKPATDFNESGWFDLLKKSLEIEDFINGHSAVMDKYDPQKQIALIVDEWGTWNGVEPGTNPGFLYQQNTLRDALAAASNLNIFNNHCDRVRMANIAQMINVLQAMILTKDEEIVLTPTYHIFDLFKVHQNALWVKTSIQSPEYRFGEEHIPAINTSASIDDRGRLHISMCNLDPKSQQHIACTFIKFSPTSVSGKILTAEEMNTHNTFSAPNTVHPAVFSHAALTSSGLEVTLPPMSVVVLELEGTYELPAPLRLKNPKAGVRYDYYEGKWSHIPDFDSLTAKRSGTTGQFIIPENNSGENFAVRYDGYIKLPSDGLYTFFTNSDDGSTLVIDSTVIVKNDGQHAAQEQSGEIMLKAGFHKIQVRFFQEAGGKVLDVSFEGLGIAKQIIPSGLLYR
jgi:alpha-N-arabinofuranosidase